jgi:hypothetical protein
MSETFTDEFTLSMTVNDSPVRIRFAYQDDPRNALAALHKLAEPHYLLQIADMLLGGSADADDGT